MSFKSDSSYILLFSFERNEFQTNIRNNHIEFHSKRRNQEDIIEEMHKIKKVLNKAQRFF